MYPFFTLPFWSTFYFVKESIVLFFGTQRYIVNLTLFVSLLLISELSPFINCSCYKVDNESWPLFESLWNMLKFGEWQLSVASVEAFEVFTADWYSLNIGLLLLPLLVMMFSFSIICIMTSAMYFKLWIDCDKMIE